MPSPSHVLSLQCWQPHREAVGCLSRQICVLASSHSHGGDVFRLIPSELSIRLLLSGLLLVLGPQ